MGAFLVGGAGVRAYDDYCDAEADLQTTFRSIILRCAITDPKETLLALLQEIDALESAGEEERAIVALDQQSVGRLARVDLMQRQQMAKATYRLRRQDRARILAALKRLEESEYGWCADCGEEIAAARLAADPTTPLCLACAK